MNTSAKPIKPPSIPKRPPAYYQWALALARPVYRSLLYFKRHQLPHYQQEIAERFGCAYQAPKPIKSRQRHIKIIWCHAVSLGELNTAYPLLKSLLVDGHGLYVTSTTQTGFARAAQLFSKEMQTGQVVHGFVPVDDRAVVYRFIRRINPHLVLFVETELWANTLYLLAKHAIPAVMVNARLKEKSFRSYQKVARLSASMMANLTLVIAQDDASAQRFMALGLPKDRCVRADSLKWASTPNLSHLPDVSAFFDGAFFDSASLNNTSPKRPIWIAGSTHAGEEQAVLTAHQEILKTRPDVLLIIVPRHPERFSDVWQLCADSGLNAGRRSTGDVIAAQTQVYLADSMGELMAWYARADVALVAGSLVDIGGHNPIEPASLAKPIIMGRYVSACDVLVDALKDAGALVQVGDTTDTAGIAQAVLAWLDNPTAAQASGQAGQALAISKQNATAVQKQHLAPFLR